jgi:ferric-dicitrate binding protein FerR (iron transport regulator)
MTPEAFKELIDQYSTGDLSPESRAAFASLLEQPQYRKLLEAELERTFMEDVYEAAEPAQRKERLNKLIREKIAAAPAVVIATHRVHFLKRGWVRIAAAAIIILLLGSAVLVKLTKPPVKESSIAGVAPAPEIAPGHDGAILTLADGSKIVLDSIEKGKLVSQAGAELVLGNNQLTYKAQAQPAAAISYNMLNVPRGRQFRVVLPDGTNVWLNAASSLRYPTAFTGATRQVEITGEAYFEVAHNAAMPFIVKKGETEITVLGTHFNINAYDEESTQDITLLEGSVQVKHGGNSLVIKPGQQARIGNGIKLADEVDLDEVVAWKNGKFQFGETADIQTIMRQVANWYDVDVKYSGTNFKHIGGTISRDVNLSQLLKVLETTGVVHFRVQGKTVEVLPQSIN